MRYVHCWTILLTLGLFSSPALAQARFLPTLNEARKVAAAEGQYIILDVSADWCPPCQKMAREVYPDPEFARYSQKHVFIVVDAYKDTEGQRLSASYEVQVFPTFIVLDSEANEIDRFTGGRTTSGLIEEVDLILEDPRPFREISKAADDAPADLSLQFRAGKRALGRSDPRRARQLLERAATLAETQNPEMLHTILLALHQACFEDGAFAEAIELLDRLEEKVPQIRQATPWRLRRARALMSIDRNDEAAEILDEALKADSMQDRAEARAIFDRLPKKYKRHGEELEKILSKGRERLEKRQFADAEQLARQALEMDSSQPGAHLILAETLLRDSAEAARDHSEKGLKYLRLARCLDKNDLISYEVARELLAPDASPAMPVDEKARKKFENAEKHFAAQRYKSAADDYVEVLTIEPTFARGYLHLGDCHFSSGNFDNALKLYQEAVRRAPNDASGYRFAADALSRLGRADEAYQWLIESLLVDPEYPPAWLDLERVVSGQKGFERHTDLVPPRLAVAGPEDDYEALFRDLSPGIVAAWREYVNHRLYWKSTRFAEQFPDAAAYFYSAREERECLEKLVERWSQMKSQKPELRDEKLDFIREVAIDGHLDSLVFLEMFGEQYRAEYQPWLRENRDRIASYLDHFIFAMPMRRAGRRDDGVSSSAIRAYNQGAALHNSSPDEAIAQYELALAHAPHYTSALGNLSILYTRAERWEDAVALLERWLQLEPQSYRPYDGLSLVEYRRGNAERAAELVKRALELVDDPEQRERLERNLKVFQPY